MNEFDQRLIPGSSRCLKALDNVPKQAQCAVSLVGGAPLFLGNAPYPVEVYNDLDSAVLYLFEVLRRDDQRKALHSMLNSVDRAVELDDRPLLEGYRSERLVDMDRIALWYVCASQLLSKQLQKLRERKLFKKNGDYEVFRRDGKASFLYRELKEVDSILPDLHGRLFRMQLEHYPIEKILQIYDGPDTLFLVDMDHLPYVAEEEVLSLLHAVQGTVVMLSIDANNMDVVGGGVKD